METASVYAYVDHQNLASQEMCRCGGLTFEGPVDDVYQQWGRTLEWPAE